jgi:hypothetical protein
MEHGIDIVGAIFALGIVLWLAGGAKWLEEKTRQLSLDNDRKAAELEKLKGGASSTPTT